MAKDPAFLFYHEDFLVGVSDMSNEEVGAYIRCLCTQASKGGLTEKHMKKICETNETHMIVVSKFIFDEEKQFYVNSRLKVEVEKRKRFTESRANNRSKPNKQNNISDSYETHMVNENENVIIDKGKGGLGEKPLGDNLDAISIKHNSYLKQCLEQKQWIETLEIQKVIMNGKIEVSLKNYNLHLIAQSESKTSLKDYKSHFVNWMNKRNQQKAIEDKNKQKTGLL